MTNPPLKHPAVLAWHTLIRCFKPVFAIYWGIVIAVFAASIVINRANIDGSQWQYAIGSVRIYLFIVGTTITFNHLPILSGHGIVRRHVSGGIMLFGATLCAACAVMLWIGFAAEHIVYAVNHWKQTIGNTVLFDHYTQVPGIAAEYFIYGMYFFASGHCIVAAFYRFGRIGGIIGIVIYLAIQYVAENGIKGLTLFPLHSDGADTIITAPDASKMIVNAVLAVLLLIAAHAMLRTADIKPKSR